MPQKIVFGWNNQIDSAASIAASSYVATLPPENVQNKLRTKVWRTTGVGSGFSSAGMTIDIGSPLFNTFLPVPFTGAPNEMGESEYLDIDFGAAKRITMFALVGHNMTPDGRIRIQLNSVKIWDSTPVDVTIYCQESVFGYGDWGYGLGGYGGTMPNISQKVTPPRVYFVDSDIYGNVPEYRYARISFGDETNPDGYLEFGRLFLGDYLQSSKNFIYGAKHTIIDPSDLDESGGGIDWGNRKNLYATITLSIKNIEEDEKFFQFMEFYYAVGITENFFMTLFPANSRGRHMTSFYGRFIDQIDFEYAQLLQSNVDISFKEVR